MNDNTNKRIDFVDLTKGICIILVVMAHIDGAFAKFDESSMISCFRMPLYFFISGIFFKSYEGFAGFLIRKINKLLIPFTFFYRFPTKIRRMENRSGSIPFTGSVE
jgi:fucose 4-O-acetylase-like acetyltransferase